MMPEGPEGYIIFTSHSCFCFFMYDLSGRDLITSGGARTTKLIILYRMSLTPSFV